MQAGDILGSYQLERLLGEGSMGQVFQARHVRLGRQVALKVLRSNFAHDSLFVRRFFQEAHAVNQINHEHIVEIFDFVEDAAAGHVYCVMELLRGQRLSELLREDKLSLTRIRRLMVQMCAALGAAHQLGVVHRDVKPDNLFIIHKSGQADFLKVLDFGVAKVLTAEGIHGTLDGTIIGTPTYMSPEQAAGLPVDPRADIYAVGTVLFELLSGQPPFVAANFGQLMVKILTEPPPALPTHTPAGELIPESLVALTARCLAKEPENRPDNLAEVITCLLAEASPAPAVTPEDRPTRPMPLPSEFREARRTGWVAVASALAAMGLTLALMRVGTSPAVTSPPPGVAAAPVAEALPAAPVAEAPPTPRPITLAANSAPPGTRVARADTSSTLEVPLGSAEPKTTRAATRASSGRGTPARTSSPRKAAGGSRDAVIDPFAP